MRSVVRDMMNFHVRDIENRKAREAGTRDPELLRMPPIKTTVHGSVIRDQRIRVREMGDEVLFDDLDLGSRAFLLHEVVAAAERHGLQYLCDATMHRRALVNYPEKVKTIFEAFSDDQFMERDQYHDFVDGQGFRRTLLSHSGVHLDRKVDLSTMTRFHFASALAPASARFKLEEPGTAEFGTEPRGDRSRPIICSARRRSFISGNPGPRRSPLGRSSPTGGKTCGRSSGQPKRVAEYEVATTCGGTLSRGELRFRGAAPQSAASRHRDQRTADGKCSGPMAGRHQAPMTSLRHRTVVFDDEVSRQFITLVDGAHRRPTGRRPCGSSEGGWRCAKGQTDHARRCRASAGGLARLALLVS
jgi:hypothetical protein